MKSRYKLLGALWDGLPFDEESPAILEDISKDNVPHLSLSRLLSFSSMDEVQNSLINVGSDHSIIVDADFYPTCNNKIMSAFLSKRIRQVWTYLSQNYAEVIFVKSKE